MTHRPAVAAGRQLAEHAADHTLLAEIDANCAAVRARPRGSEPEKLSLGPKKYSDGRRNTLCKRFPGPRRPESRAQVRAAITARLWTGDHIRAWATNASHWDACEACGASPVHGTLYPQA